MGMSEAFSCMSGCRDTVSAMGPDLLALISRRIHWDITWPPDPSRQVNEFHEWGDLPFFVSTFDHPLTEKELVASKEEPTFVPFLYYGEARKKGFLQDYMLGEARFKAFYSELSRKGAWLGLSSRKPMFLPGSSRRLSRLIKDSLREHRRMDITFQALPVRVLGGHDRTDLFLPATAAVRDEIRSMAIRHGLFVLPYRSV